MLLALSAIWGASFMFIKVGVRELEPSTLIFVRVGLGALTLVVVSLAALGRRAVVQGLRAVWLPFLVLGLLNSALPFWLISWAEQDVDSGLAAILQAAAPLAAAVLALRIDRSQRVTGARLAGLLVGFAGVALLVGMPGGSSSPIRALAVVLSAVFYAMAALYSGRRLGDVPPLLVATGTMIAATLVTLPAGVIQAPDAFPGWKVTGSLLALGIALHGRRLHPLLRADRRRRSLQGDPRHLPGAADRHPVRRAAARRGPAAGDARRARPDPRRRRARHRQPAPAGPPP